MLLSILDMFVFDFFKQIAGIPSGPGAACNDNKVIASSTSNESKCIAVSHLPYIAVSHLPYMNCDRQRPWYKGSQ